MANCRLPIHQLHCSTPLSNAVVRSSLHFVSTGLACLQSDMLFSLDEIDEIPADLAGIWAYVIWEAAGCPDRSQEAADSEYRQGISEMQRCLARGKTLDELWQVRGMLFSHSIIYVT